MKTSKRGKSQGYATRVTAERLESRVLFTAGALDNTFGAAGVADGALFATPTYIDGLAIQSNGKVIVSVFSNPGRYADATNIAVGIARFNRDGSLDTTFGNSGEVLGSGAVVVQTDGKIVVTGGGNPNAFDVARYLPNGSLDQTFGTGGTAQIPFGGLDNVDAQYAVAVQPDGRIVVAGEAGSTAQNDQSIVLRLMPDGQLDTSFGTDGITRTAGEATDAIVLQPDGKILLDGNMLARLDANGELDPTFGDSGYLPSTYSTGFSGSPSYPIALAGNQKIVVADNRGNVYRFNDNGSLDTSFGDDGVVASPLKGEAFFEGVLIQSGGDIVQFTTNGIVRFTPAGAVDDTFGSDGIATLAPSLTPYDAVLQADGDIVVAGTTAPVNSDAYQGYGALGEGGPFLARFTANGRLDHPYGYYGTVLHPNGISGNILAMAVQSDGKVVVAGSEISTGDSSIPTEAALARYNADGSLDASFGAGGRAIFGVAGNGLYSALAIEPDGDIVAGGYCRFGGRGVMLIVRFLPNGQRDRSFGVNGAVMTNLGPAFLECSGVAAQPDGDIVADGTSYDAKGKPQIDVVRFLPNGAIDAKFGAAGVEAIDPGGAGAIAGAFGLVVEPNGKIVIAGTVGVSAAAIRMTPSGSLDATFGNGGVASTLYVSNGVSDPAEATAVAVNAADDILIDERPTGSTYGSAVVRFLPNGKIDPSFGQRGTLDTYSDLDGSYAMALAPNGQIVVGGVDSATETTTEIARYNAKGLDSTFGVAQLSAMGTNVGYSPTYYPPVSVLLIGADGKIYAAAGSDVFRVLSK